ncbi:MAG: serine/threonine protein kinase, partial [Flavobacteriaceae bacterium]|nr:serine/threonine protein kinase [Flavobacteriaceae bacterium]
MNPIISIPNVQLGESLGEGAAATVFAGTLADTGRAVAVKVVPARRGDAAGLAKRALQEGRLCWSLDHPNIVRVFGSGQTADGHVWILMERLTGETLYARLARRGTLSPAEVLAVARDVARGLCSIHARGVVHRDVKPDNVFLCAGPPEQTKLLDLGIASLAANDPTRLVHTQAGLVFGTPGYMAPEQARGESIDARTDVYGLAATMYHCLTGQVRYADGTVVDVLRRLVTGTEPPPAVTGVPSALADLVRRCLHPEPARRP